MESIDDTGPSTSEAKDPERFYCPYPGCNRSFAELWRLKVHYRAPPDIRGSGKERGHGTELTHCPKCGKTLKPGKHHVGCSAGKAPSRQATKRGRTSGDGEPGSQQGDGDGPGKQHKASELGPFSWPNSFAGSLPLSGPPPGFNPLAHPAVPPPPMFPGPDGSVTYWQDANGFQHMFVPGFQQPGFQQPGFQQQQQPQQPFYPGHPQQLGFGFAPTADVPMHAPMPLVASEPDFLAGIFDDDLPDVDRIPSPPPLPADFHTTSAPPSKMLFNFGQFSQKLPSTQPANAKLAKDLTEAEAMDLASSNIIYDHTDDGELMQLLFGVADEAPSMATIHLHKWHNVEDLDELFNYGPGAMGAAVQPGTKEATAGSGGENEVQPAGHVQNSEASTDVNLQPAALNGKHPEWHHQQPTQQNGHLQLVPMNKESAAAATAAVMPAKPEPLDTAASHSNKQQDFLGLCIDDSHRDILDAETYQLLQSVE